MNAKQRIAPGLVRDAILEVFRESYRPLSPGTVQERVAQRLGSVPESSVRSYLLLNTPAKFRRVGRGLYALRTDPESPAPRNSAEPDHPMAREEARAYDEAVAPPPRAFRFGKATLVCHDCLDWLKSLPDLSLHGVVTDPPYGIREYTPTELEKLRAGRGGVWRMPPSFDGASRSPLPRFTILNRENLSGLRHFFLTWGRTVLPKLVPGANVVMASNPLLAAMVSEALVEAGLERRGELVRLTMTMRGGDRPKNAEREFADVSVMPRSMWEPWLLFRKPLEGRVQDNLRKWGTGGFRRIGAEKPFGDVIKSAPTNRSERAIANHPSLKPQAFLRQIVRAVLPLGTGCIADPFAGSGSTLAAAEAVGYESVGAERDERYFELACESIPKLAALRVDVPWQNGKNQIPNRSKRTINARRNRGAANDTATLPLVF